LLAKQQAEEHGLNTLQTAGVLPDPPSMAGDQLPGLGAEAQLGFWKKRQQICLLDLIISTWVMQV